MRVDRCGAVPPLCPRELRGNDKGVPAASSAGQPCAHNPPVCSSALLAVQFSYPLRQVGLPAPLLQLALNGWGGRRASPGCAAPGARCCWACAMPLVHLLLGLRPCLPAVTDGRLCCRRASVGWDSCLWHANLPMLAARSGKRRWRATMPCFHSGAHPAHACIPASLHCGLHCHLTW